MSLHLKIPQKPLLKPSIMVFGVGGAGCNAVNNMIAKQLEGVSFIVANTDAQALAGSKAERKIQLGETITQGLGAGAYPEVGKASAEESAEEIQDAIRGCHMIFITAGMGGGTGTGAAPVVAKFAREQGILTVAVVTKPFQFEGAHRMKAAEAGLKELQQYVDTMIVVPNQNLFRVADKGTTFADAFKMADNVLYSGVRSITDLMIMPGLINLDFADVRTIMREMGKAMMGTGEATGQNRAIEAAEAAISNPLLDNASMKGARGVLINITGGPDLTLFEVDEAANRIREEVDAEANIIFGSTYSSDLQGTLRVSVVATGIEGEARDRLPHNRSSEKIVTLPLKNAASKITAENFQADESQLDEAMDVMTLSIEGTRETPKQKSKGLFASIGAWLNKVSGGDELELDQRVTPATFSTKNIKITDTGAVTAPAQKAAAPAVRARLEEPEQNRAYDSPDQRDDLLDEGVLEIPAYLRRKSS